MGRIFLAFVRKPSDLTMFTQASILATLVLSATSLSLESTKAASSLINCGCQCSSITFLDSAGVEQGNCKTVDGTGAQWCYVDSTASTCQDLVPSQRFPHNPWSYEACATPAAGSPLCPAVVAVPYHIHAPVVVAPADHVHAPVVVASADHVHLSAPEHVHVPIAVSSPSHVHPVGQHNTEIPQGLNAPIPKAAGVEAPTK